MLDIQQVRRQPINQATCENVMLRRSTGCAKISGKWAWLLTAIFLQAVSVQAQMSSPSHACGCPDGRRFSTGASLFGKNSARVLVTGFRPQPPARGASGELTRCTDLLVLGQVIRLLNTPDGRPFLKRESLKRGVIHQICNTRIHFVEAKKSYDFFADDGSALTLTGNEVESMVIAAPEEPPEIELDENLTGQDLLRLMPPKGSGGSLSYPDRSAFDEEDLKEGAYVVCTRRSKAPLADAAGLQEANIVAGMFGRIEKRAGFRSEPRWIVEVLPDSAPPVFWRSLISIPRMYARPRAPALPRKVILASSRMLEINHLLDRSGVEWTHFGDVSDETGDREEQGTDRLPDMYAPPALPLEENVAAAQTSRIFAAVRKATAGLELIPRNSEMLARRGTLVLEEGTPDAVPDLMRRQCFLGAEGPVSSPLLVTGAGVKVFRPKDYSQVPPHYYAIDLELQLRPNLSTEHVPILCRFPSASIDLALLDMARRILSTEFEIRRVGAKSW
jgi:hypothetical protein